ncbi:Flagellar cap protein [Serratia plymuthica]|nr:Flagellar cap protein [Serratia plymuthica]
MLDKLSTAEQQRLTPYTTQQSSYSAQLTAYGVLKGSLEKFDNLSSDLAKPDFFSNTTASKHDQFTITTTDKAVAGNYSVNVIALAQPQTLTTQTAIADQTQALGAAGSTNRSITITAGNPPTAVNIPLSDEKTSLVEMRDAINGAKAGVNASIMRVGDNDYQLALSSTTAGQKSTISVQVNNDTQLGNILNYDSTAKSGAMKQTVAGQDALIEINGTQITRSTNSIADALQGVTIDLKSPTKADETQNLVISTDTSGTADKIKGWVDSYNSLLDTFSALSRYTPVKTGEAQNANNGPLLGDNTLRGIQSSIKNSLSAAQDNPELKGLGNLGISTDTKNRQVDYRQHQAEKIVR